MRLHALTGSVWVMHACLLIAFLFPLRGNSIAPHPIHISVAEVRYQDGKNTLQVAIKIFADDLELALKDLEYTDLRIGAKDESSKTDEAINNYLKQKFRVQSNGKSVNGILLGRELSDDLLAVWCYLEFTIPANGNLLIWNEVLMNTYDDQKNIMDIKMNSSHHDYIICDNENVMWKYTFTSR